MDATSNSQELAAFLIAVGHAIRALQQEGNLRGGDARLAKQWFLQPELKASAWQWCQDVIAADYRLPRGTRDLWLRGNVAGLEEWLASHFQELFRRLQAEARTE